MACLRTINAARQERSGTVQLRDRAADPELTGGIARRLLELVAEFNQETRQSQAAEERL